MWARLRQNPFVAPLLVLTLGIAVALVTWTAMSRNEAYQRDLAFGAVGERNAQRVAAAVERHADLLRQVRALYVTDGDVDADRFRRFVSELMLSSAGRMRTAMMFVRPVGESAFVEAVVPTSEAGLWTGFDLRGMPAIDELLDRSLERADITASRPVSLPRSDERGGLISLLAVPVFTERSVSGDIVRSEVEGFLVTASSVDLLLDDALADGFGLEDVRDHSIAVSDVSHSSAGVPIASFGAPAVSGMPQTDEVIHVFDRTWNVATRRVALDERTLNELIQQPSTTLSTCIFLVMMLCAHIAYSLNRQKSLVQEEVASRTSELRQKNLLLERQERELAKVNLKLLEQSHTDPLTEILNRRGFEEHLEQERQRTGRTGVPYGLLIFDVDNFKGFNDHYGHVAGDEVLKRVAHIIYGEARRIDCVARFGGEEFVILASGTDAVGLLALGERVRERIQEAAIPNVESPLGVVTVSGGGALSKVDAEHEPKPVLEVADRCLYEAKATGKNRVVMRM